jgi:putative chitinase
VTPYRLALALPRAPLAWIEAACTHCDKWGVTTKERQAAFIGQCAYESSEFNQLIEILRYRDAARIAYIFRTRFDLDHDKEISPAELAIAQRFVNQPEALGNFVYSGRNGNGNMESGHGFKYRGRGPIQITGLANYRDFAFASKFDVITNPDDLLQPDVGITSALWFWTTRGLNQLADAGDYETITRRINGGINGLAERLVYIEKIKGVLT